MAEAIHLLRDENSTSSVDSVHEMLQRHLGVTKVFFTDNAERIDVVASVMAEAFMNGKKIIIAGNGGSAADAQHIAAEFVGRFVKDRRALPAIALTTDTSILTAVGNDYGYDDVFSRQVEALGNEGDVFIAISTSGNSRNIIKAVEVAKEQGVISVGLMGKDGGLLDGNCDYSFVVKDEETARVQECHLMFLHMICALIEEKMGFFS